MKGIFQSKFFKLCLPYQQNSIHLSTIRTLDLMQGHVLRYISQLKCEVLQPGSYNSLDRLSSVEKTLCLSHMKRRRISFSPTSKVRFQNIFDWKFMRLWYTKSCASDGQIDMPYVDDSCTVFQCRNVPVCS